MKAQTNGFQLHDWYGRQYSAVFTCRYALSNIVRTVNINIIIIFDIISSSTFECRTTVVVAAVVAAATI